MTGKSKRCPYCGNNPVPHLVNWYYESMDVWLSPVRRAVLRSGLVQNIRRRWQSGNCGWQITRWLLKLKIISRQNDPSRCRVRRAQVLWEEARRRGIAMSELLLFGRPFDVYVAEKEPQAPLVFSGLPRPRGYDGKALDIVDDKLALKQELSQAGLPVPAGGSVWTFRQALKIFRRIEKPVIVKPRSGSRGRHTTTFVRSEADLKKAYKIAKQLCAFVVVEEQLFGPVYRATVIGNTLAGVLSGDSPQVVGDGRRSLLELVADKNAAPHPGVSGIVISDHMRRFVARELGEKLQNPASQPADKDLADPLNYVPAAGETITLSEKIGVSYGGSSSEDYDICHPDNKDLFLRAAAAVGDPLIGFDFMIPDITVSYRQQRCGFIEANSLPFINLHHDPLHGQPRNAAGLIWDMMGWGSRQ